FFFQAEDGIRDRTVTGVQTCALPISDLVRRDEALFVLYMIRGRVLGAQLREVARVGAVEAADHEHEVEPRGPQQGVQGVLPVLRSEERRVGKEWGSGRGRMRCDGRRR